MKRQLISKLRKYQAKEKAVLDAKKSRDESKLQLIKAIHDSMRKNNLKRGDVFRMLTGWSYEKIGNVLHLKQGLRLEKEWIELINSVSNKSND